MRAAPESKAKVVVLIPDNAAVEMLSEIGELQTITGKAGRWTQVRYEDREGYVFGGFLAAEPALSCLPLRPENLHSFKGGCLGANCTSKNDPFGKIYFRADGTWYAEFEVRDQAGGERWRWRVEGDTIIAEGESSRNPLFECEFGCQGAADQQACAEKCRVDVRDKYGKTEASYPMRYEYRVNASGEFTSRAAGGDPDPVAGKTALRDSHEHEGGKPGCMYPLL